MTEPYIRWFRDLGIEREAVREYPGISNAAVMIPCCRTVAEAEARLARGTPAT